MRLLIEGVTTTLEETIRVNAEPGCAPLEPDDIARIKALKPGEFTYVGFVMITAASDGSEQEDNPR